MESIGRLAALRLSVAADDLAQAHGALQRSVEKGGVVLSSGGNDYRARGATFIFSRLNDLEPEMIAEATARAREGAEQFARDSRSRVGAIRRGERGHIRDPAARSRARRLRRQPAGQDRARGLHRRLPARRVTVG